VLLGRSLSRDRLTAIPGHPEPFFVLAFEIKALVIFWPGLNCDDHLPITDFLSREYDFLNALLR
jgi:hypothetical protein